MILIVRGSLPTLAVRAVKFFSDGIVLGAFAAARPDLQVRAHERHAAAPLAWVHRASCVRRQSLR